MQIKNLERIDALVELDVYKIPYKVSGENEVTVVCPFHTHSDSPLSLNTKKNVYKCWSSACNATGNIVDLIVKHSKSTHALVWEDLNDKYQLQDGKPPLDPQIIEKQHKLLLKQPEMLEELYKRAVTDDDIRKHRLGYKNERITIPIRNKNGDFVTTRNYKPVCGKGEPKFTNLSGRSQLSLFPIYALERNAVILCGGEIKAIVADRVLAGCGVGGLSVTGGEGNISLDLVKKFQDKTVYICMDIDDAGQRAAAKLALLLCRVAKWVGIVELPLDLEKYPTGDLNDFVAEGGDLEKLLREVEVFIIPTPSKINLDKCVPISLSKAYEAGSVHKAVKIDAQIGALCDTAYSLPKDVTVDCNKDGKFCPVCPKFTCKDDDKLWQISNTSPQLVGMMDKPDVKQRELIMDALSIPTGCKVVDCEAVGWYNVEDVRISPPLEITSSTTEKSFQPAVCIGSGLEVNETYSLRGVPIPHPDTQKITMLVGAYEPVKDSLSSYELGDTNDLLVFQPTEWTAEGVRQKCKDIAADFETNVTKIYQREALHLVVDLAYHSVLFFKFDGSLVKGWVEALIVGDSSQGKSEVTQKMQHHYDLGEITVMKNATVAGLLGGLQNIAGKWFVTWGVMPQHDRRLVFWEEIKGAETKVLAKLTDMRSRGVATIDKIEKKKTHARTRICGTSNTRTGRDLDTYSYGIEAFLELMGAPEDLRRFDICLALSKYEVDEEEINKLSPSRDAVEHKYTSDLSRKLVLWAWTRTEDQVVFESEQFIADEASKLCKEYTEAIPIVDTGSMRLKLARLACAVAARTYSINDSETLYVRNCHVEFIAKTLRKLYNSTAFGYDKYTEAEQVKSTLLGKEGLAKAINSLNHPKDFARSITHADQFDMTDIQDWVGGDRNDAQELLSILVRKHAVRRSSTDRRNYVKTSAFITLLKDLVVGDEPDYLKRSDY